jgi:HD-GYP domain-containing protein (c-di-GMP phosphodiesterase class II)
MALTKTKQEFKYEQLIRLGISLSSERNINKLLKDILDGALALSQADAGTIYFKTDHDTLSFAIRSRSDDLPAFELPLHDPETGEPNNQYVSIYTALTGETVKIDDIYADNDSPFDLEGTRKFDQETGYRTVSMISVPMIARNNKIIGVMQIVNAFDIESGNFIPFSDDDKKLLEALASQAAVALDNSNLMQAQQDLMDAFIKVIAGAIDAKSPYTGGHCARVPELSVMLAEAAQASEEPLFKEFNFDEDEWREFKIAGWLHDCGKVTTPEYVVDKDTKLQTIYNRIHEIRMRFEVLLRDEKINYLEAVANDPEQASVLKQQLDKKTEQLYRDFEFIAKCNVGGEFMSDDAVDRLTRLSKMCWTRHFDDRLGLSDMEKQYFAEIPKPDLPCTEQVLADKPEHIIKRNINSNDAGESIHSVIPTPKYLFNRGELYNLSIRKGTLTAEDRFIINDHIVQTILMLKKLPFPESLARVTEYAGGHHEKMDGTGYPLGLSKNELSLPARIMAIADIYEALTASDRPYKKAKTLTESLKIMSFMVKDKHIDEDLFRLFLSSGVYQQYAERFLDPSQIDEVDINDYLTA